MSGPGERALWVVRDRVLTPAACDELLADATERAIRHLVVQVRGRADAYFAGGLEPRAEALGGSAFDPLGHLVERGRVVGARIHAWLNTHYVWSGPAAAPPEDPRHLVNAHPDWLLGPRPVRHADPAGGPGYDGAWIDPASARAAVHTLAVAADVARRYPVEGVHWDHVRYPDARYAASPDDHRHITSFVREAAAALRRARPDLTISAAVFPDPADARDRVLQRWPEWAAAGLVDLLCPMAYREDAAEVGRLLRRARAAAPATRMWGGIIAPAAGAAGVREQVRAALDAGCDGAILFAYDPARRDLLDAFAAG